MSLYTTVYALESKIKAPEIGDAGHVGCPPVDSNTDQHPFVAKVCQSHSNKFCIAHQLAMVCATSCGASICGK